MIYFLYSPAGEISESGCWLAICGPYLYIANTLTDVAWVCYDEWEMDKHLVG